MKIYIYQIWFPTSKKSYIGQTDNLQRRMPNHLKSGSLVCKALWKYDDWQITILHTCKTRDEANRIEIEEIRNFNSIAPNGYNLTAGGDGSGIPCEETREKMSKSHTGKKHSKETIEKIRGSRLGYKPSKESIERMRQAHLGKENPGTHSAKSEIKRLKTRLKKLE